MKLSIIILVCDKDVQFLDKLLSQIHEHIKLDYEIILVDNRELNTDYLDKHNLKVISNGFNSYNFEGRRIGLDYAKGEYTWYVDADDEIISDLLQKELDKDVDVIQFYAKFGNFDTIPLGSFHNNIKMFGYNLWSRIIRTDLLKSSLSAIKRGIKLVGHEDRFIWELILSKEPSIAFIDKFIYRYRTDRSIASSNNKSKEMVNHLLIGQEELDYLYSFIPNSSKSLMTIKEQNKTLSNIT